MNKEKYIIENGIKYEFRGDVYYPMLKWGIEMNNIKASAEEIILWEIIYC